MRSLLRSPGFTLAAVLTLTLGIGATTAIFSVVYGVLLRPLPYHDPDALVLIQAQKRYPTGVRRRNLSAVDLEDWLARARAFESLAASAGTDYALASAAGVEAISGAIVSDRFFDTLGRPMTLGRPIGSDREPVVVLSRRLWTRLFASDPGVVGRSVSLTGRAFTIVGVAPPDLNLPSEGVDVWTPLAFARAANDPDWVNFRNGGGFDFIARLEDSVSVDRARVEAVSIASALERAYPDQERGIEPVVVSLARNLTESVRPALRVLMAAVGLLLLIACANVVNLLLARHASRAREIAIRRALGAGSARLILEGLGESLWLSAAGAVAGAALASAVVSLLVWAEPAQLPRLDAIRVDAPVLAFTTGIAALTAMLIGILPAVHLSRRDVAGTLAAGSPTVAGTVAGRRLRAALVVGELAIAIVLLVGAALLGRTLVRLLQTDLGVKTDRVITAWIDLSLGRTLSDAEQIARADAIVERLRALPSVGAAGIGSGLPPRALYFRTGFTAIDPADGHRAEQLAALVPAGPDYFAALGVPLVKGRSFLASDTAEAPEVAVLTVDAARRFFGNRDPIGATLPIGRETGKGRADVRVVGVVGNVKYAGLDREAEPVIYRPYAQKPFSIAFVVVRTRTDPAPGAADLRSAIRAVDPAISVIAVRTLDEVVSREVAQPRFRAWLLAGLAGLGLLLSAMGLAGVIAYSVSQRTVEIGIRVALGATASNVVALVVREGMALALAGAVAGLAGSWWLSRSLRSLLFEVEPGDAVSSGLAIAGLLVVAALASYVPARRAARVDPIEALRTT